eukprot:m.136496 g.136496  ORF g.136496 m.136496 type:complete len:188 (+) comp10705_c0_seq1:64-627(+)
MPFFCCGSSSTSPLNNAELMESYEDCTFLSRNEIFAVYEWYTNLCGGIPNPPLERVVPRKVISDHLQRHPFRKRIAHIFSNEKGEFTFDELLEMVSVFSDKASVDVKATYAFRIYDKTNDDVLDESDLRDVFMMMMGCDVGKASKAARLFLKEVCPKRRRFISIVQFKQIAYRVPDFLDNFKINFIA